MAVQKNSAQQSHSSRASHSLKKKSSEAKSGRWLWFCLGMTGVAMLSATAGALLAFSFSSKPLMQSKLSSKDELVFGQGAPISGNGLQFSQLTRPVNILVLGMSVLPEDVRNPPAETQHLSYSPQVNSFEGLSDTMLLLRFNPQTKKLIALSIPRDTRTLVEGHGIEKINAANLGGGAALSAKTVSNLLGGVEIDRYIRVNVLGFAKLVDVLGGVTFYIPKDMKYKDDTQHLYVNLKAGKQHLNGDQAMQLLRFRHDALGDIGRIQRQQLMMRTLMEQALNPATLAQLPQILQVVQSYIDTNLTVSELFAIAGFAAQSNRSNVNMLMVPGRFSGPEEYNTSYWIPNHKGITNLITKHFDLASQSSQHASEPAALSIVIQDSTGHPRAVRALVRTLEASGYRNVQIAKPWTENLSMTHIVAQQGDGDSAEAIRNALGLGEVRVESTGLLNSDVTIRLGQDWLQRKATSARLTEIGSREQRSEQGEKRSRRSKNHH